MKSTMLSILSSALREFNPSLLDRCEFNWHTILSGSAECILACELALFGDRLAYGAESRLRLWLDIKQIIQHLQKHMA